MGRVYVANSEPNRDLIRLGSNVQRGADVRALESAAERRLEARGVSIEQIGRDGVLLPDEFDKLVTTARLLGVREDTLVRRDSRGRRVLTVGAQRVIRYPGRRTDEQLQRAEDRMRALERERAEREKDKPQGGGVSGLTSAQRSEARDRAVAAMELAYRHRGAVHYTQSSARWQGISTRRRSAAGRYPNYADCSSLTTWALWNALTGVGGMDFPDIVNGQRWQAGFTGTQVRHGARVDFDDLMPADLIFYGSGWPYGHVVMYVGGGLVLSHGSESGPHRLRIRYRGDDAQARRYI